MGTIIKDIPDDGILDLEFDEAAFKLLANRIITHLDLEVRIHHKPKENLKAKLPVIITQIYAPGTAGARIANQRASGDTEEEKQVNMGLLRAGKEFFMHMQSKMWHIVGYINAGNKTPICIAVVPDVLSTYSLKRNGELLERFNSKLN